MKNNNKEGRERGRKYLHAQELLILLLASEPTGRVQMLNLSDRRV